MDIQQLPRCMGVTPLPPKTVRSPTQPQHLLTHPNASLGEGGEGLGDSGARTEGQGVRAQEQELLGHGGWRLCVCVCVCVWIWSLE